MALAACCLKLGACALDPEAWSLELLAIDPDPRAMLSPSIAHDLELQGYGRQLLRRRVAYFYCEFFHQCFFLIFRPCCTTNQSALKSFIGMSLIS
jgi:hypothetical protein